MIMTCPVGELMASPMTEKAASSRFWHLRTQGLDAMCFMNVVMTRPPCIKQPGNFLPRRGQSHQIHTYTVTMGNDIWFISSSINKEPKTFEEINLDYYIISSRSNIGLLALLCFRHYDINISEGSSTHTLSNTRYVVEFDRAICQLCEGVDVLKKRFRSANVLDPYLEYFIRYLKRYESNYLHMDCSERADNMSFDLILNHALLGIIYPEMKMYYSPDQFDNWSVNCEPAANGIMTWCGALRRITHIAGSREEIDHEELFTPSDLEDIDEIGVYGFMRND